jgi:hypothetical protein
MMGNLAASAARIKGMKIHFTLSGGASLAKVMQWGVVHCPADGN